MSAPSRLAGAERAIVVVAAVAGLALVGLLVYTMLARAGHPYDLEWMEGGLLTHARRIADGDGIYVAPSADFIPFLYTPLYPSLVALVGEVVGISYAVGRAISVLAVLATLGLLVAAVRQADGGERRLGLAGGLLAAGLYAASYPWVDGWFDLVGADSLFVAMVIGGLLMIRVWARHPGAGGRWRIAAAAYLLALAFFCKQTGVLFCAVGGAHLVLLHWRRAPIFVAVAGLVGLGGTWLFQRASGGWFWTYVYEVHQVHDFSRDRFVASFGNILGHFPAMTAAIVLGLVATVVGAVRQRRVPPGAAGLLYWTPVFAVACVVGALGWGTQWAHFNAYMPAMATGALAAGTALPAIAGGLSAGRDGDHEAIASNGATGSRRRGLALAVAALVVVAVAVDLGRAWWSPARFVPRPADVAAGDALIARLRAAPGDVFVPYHPWYAVLAGKPVHVHRMGLLDVTYKNRLQVAGLREALAEQRYDLVVLDDRPPGPELAGLVRHYRIDELLPPGERPRTYSGASVSPRSISVPNRPLVPPAGATVLWDFEDGRLGGWSATGTAWGVASASAGTPGARGYGGRFYLSSARGRGRESATGVVESPSFALRGTRLTLRLAGGADQPRLRAELVVDGEVRASATGPGAERMVEVVWPLAGLAGRTARIRLVDSSPTGHLHADEIWSLE